MARRTDPNTRPTSSPSDTQPGAGPGITDAPEEDSDGILAPVLAAVKPLLRGWIHAGIFPVAVLAGVVLIILSPPTAPRVASIIFAITTALLFGTSAVYHRGTWSPPVNAALRRADHSNIFLIIAGTYTPLAVLLLEKQAATILLTIVWSGALLGLAARMIWLGAPRWVYTPVYLALGSVAVGYMGMFYESGGAGIVWLISLGGLAYILGAVVYATKRPRLSLKWFGFHELFHVGTVIGWGCHYAAILVAVLRFT